MIELLLITQVWMLVAVMLGINITFYYHVKRPQVVIHWDGWTTEAVLHRICGVEKNGNVNVWGDGEMSLPLGLKGHAGQQLELLLVSRKQVLHYA